jgi:hypothetical protein
VAEEVNLEQASPFVDREGLDRCVDRDGGVVYQRPHCSAVRVSLHPSSESPDVVRVGDVDDQRLYPRPSDCVGVLVAPDAREYVEPPPGQFACSGRADAARRASYYGDLLEFR